MKFNLIEKTYPPISVTAPATTDWTDVTGCDSLCYVMTASAASTPGTASITLQGSLDQTNPVAIGSAVNVTTNGSLELSADRPKFRWYRVSYAIASGSYTSTLKFLAKGDKD